jgi:hypothetical protein
MKQTWLEGAPDMSWQDPNPFDTPDLVAEQGRFHPMISYLLMSLCTYGALLMFLHAIATSFTLLNSMLIFFLVLSSISVYRTA